MNIALICSKLKWSSRKVWRSGRLQKNTKNKCRATDSKLKNSGNRLTVTRNRCRIWAGSQMTINPGRYCSYNRGLKRSTKHSITLKSSIKLELTSWKNRPARKANNMNCVLRNWRRRRPTNKELSTECENKLRWPVTTVFHADTTASTRIQPTWSKSHLSRNSVR